MPAGVVLSLPAVVGNATAPWCAAVLMLAAPLRSGCFTYHVQADWAGREWQFDIVANKRNG